MDEDFVSAGDVLIVELMIDPAAVGDSDGEWIELLNTSTADLDLLGWQLTASGGGGITIGSSLVLPAGGVVVLGPEGDTSLNGGYDADYVYDAADLSLSSGGDSLALSVADLAVASLEYTTAWPIAAGASLSLDPTLADASSAALSDSWCLGQSSYGDGDLGTPGAINDWCPEIDHDADGYTVDEGDCDDADARANPDMTEVWDWIDDDCDGSADNVDVNRADGLLDGDATDYLGWQNSLSTGDYDGDGQLDFAVGGTYVGSDGVGGVYVIDGADHTRRYNDASDRAVALVSGAGAQGYLATMDQDASDIDGDGFDDLVIVGTDVESATYGTVAATVFRGGTDGITGTLSADEGDIVFTGAASTYVYTKVESSTDYDGDGAADLVFGDYYPDDGHHAGDIYMFSGADLGDGNFDWGGDADVWLYGDNDEDYLGNALGGGDTNGDGYADIAIGASGYDGGATDGGAIYLVRGRASFSGSGSIGFVARAAIVGDTEGGRLGRQGEPRIGDFDGDGDADLAVSAPNAGEVYLFWDAGSLAGEVHSSDADLTIAGAEAQYLGLALSSGDVDDDGIADLLAGAPDGHAYDTSADVPGVVYLFRGSSLADGPTSVGAADARFEANNPLLNGMTIATGDLSGDGRDDLLTTSPQVGGSDGRLFIFVAP